MSCANGTPSAAESGFLELEGEFDRVYLKKWHRRTNLAPVYAKALQSIAAWGSLSKLSVIAHGSVIWGGWTLLRNSLPVSDVDLLVVVPCASDLPTAAHKLRQTVHRLTVPEMPFFKISPKFRTLHEIASPQITVNELAALRHGQLLCGRASLPVFRPNPEWFRFQAELAVRTRIVYVAMQRAAIRGNRFELPLTRYLAARLILDVPTVALMLKGMAGQSYTARVGQFMRLFSTSQSLGVIPFRRIAAMLSLALKTKAAPELYQCGSIEEAAKLLLDVAAALGVAPVESTSITDDFWIRERPLDARDHYIWSAAAQ